MTTTDIRLIAVDLDGTLLNTAHEMSARNEAALRAAVAQGIRVIFATGKTRHSARALLDRLKLDTPGIYLQGLSVHDADGTPRHEQKLDNGVARRVITYAEDRGFDVIAYAGSRILVRAASAHADELTTQYGEPAPEVVGPLVNLLNTTQFHKLILARKGDFKKIKALRWQLEVQLNGAARLMQAGIMDMVEVLPPGASKARALKTLLAEMGVAPEHVLAIGDGENDIELIQMAGVGVAVGNAADALKQVADYVVADNDADGVAEAVERFALKQPETPQTEAEAKAAGSDETPEVAAEAVEAKDEAS